MINEMKIFALWVDIFSLIVFVCFVQTTPLFDAILIYQSSRLISVNTLSNFKNMTFISKIKTQNVIKMYTIKLLKTLEDYLNLPLD